MNKSKCSLNINFFKNDFLGWWDEDIIIRAKLWMKKELVPLQIENART